MAGYAVAIGRELGLNGVGLRNLEWGALVHDIGKIGVPDAILLKPGPLTPEEWGAMRPRIVGRRRLPRRFAR
ncbi:MAG: response regulator [bacterium]|nr:MAG: response regulator [bacterium]